jgi:DNA-binding response OmpR family regulator
VRILVVEDDDAIAEPLATGLQQAGFTTSRVATGAEALAEERYDLVLLDLGLPDIDGYEICRELRARSGIPIIVITARGDELDRVLGLELGADDYMVKPFGMRELVARIRAVARRAVDTDVAQVMNAGDIEVDRARRIVRHKGETVDLTPKEFDLLTLLVERPGVVFTREQIMNEVWDPHWYGPTKTLDVHVASLRRKLGAPEAIETIRGVGFRLAPDS